METKIEKILEAANTQLPRSIRGYEQDILKEHSVKFGEHKPLQLTPDKSYTAKTVVPVISPNNQEAEMYVIAFSKGDGTGNNSSYHVDEIEIEGKLHFRKNQERVIPRSKKGIAMEAFFPFFSVHEIFVPNSISRNIVCLEEIMFRNQEGSNLPTLVSQAILGHNWNKYGALGTEAGPQFIYLTTGYKRNGKRFGDPHSIYYHTDQEDALQVVGFLPITNKDSKLCEIFEEIATIPEGL